MLEYGLLFLSGCAYIIFLYLDNCFIKKIKIQEEPANRKFVMESFVAKIGIFLLMFFLQPPLIVMLVMYVFICMMHYYPHKSKDGVIYWFSVFFRFIIFGSSFVIWLGIIAIVSKISIYEAYQNRTCWILAFGVSISVQACMYAMLARRYVEEIRIVFDAKKYVKKLLSFQLFAVGYLIFDGFLLFFPVYYELLNYYILGSALLILWQFYLFLVHTYNIVLKKHEEEEYYRLEKEWQDRIKEKLILHDLAYRDHLTGVYTRRFAIEALEALVREKKRFSIIYIDVNGLKKVNDQHGHLEGDEYLVLVTSKLNQILGKEDILARMGGDEFVILSICMDETEAQEKLEEANQWLMKHANKDYETTFSFGIVHVLEDNGRLPDEIWKQADAKMYECKRKRVG